MGAALAKLNNVSANMLLYLRYLDCFGCTLHSETTEPIRSFFGEFLFCPASFCGHVAFQPQVVPPPPWPFQRAVCSAKNRRTREGPRKDSSSSSQYSPEEEEESKERNELGGRRKNGGRGEDLAPSCISLPPPLFKTSVGWGEVSSPSPLRVAFKLGPRSQSQERKGPRAVSHLWRQKKKRARFDFNR